MTKKQAEYMGGTRAFIVVGIFSGTLFSQASVSFLQHMWFAWGIFGCFLILVIGLTVYDIYNITTSSKDEVVNRLDDAAGILEGYALSFITIHKARDRPGPNEATIKASDLRVATAILEKESQS